ncbi:MAG: serine/threonine-protein kinase [Myxococcota bacterium]
MARKCPVCGTVYGDDMFFCGHDGSITIQEQDPTDVDPRLGQQLKSYIVAARVADGAMGRVYEGRHPETKKQVAIKVLHEDVAQDAVAVERFKREFETAEEFDHPNIVNVEEFGQTEDGSWFMTMEYLKGEELSRTIEREGSLSPARALRIICQLAEALDHAHSFGVIHRDLKPDNVFLVRSDDGDIVKILDFGSVKLQMETGPKLTAFGTTLGSPYYMSPEQAMGKLDVDQRTDVFAIAAILWEMATGRVAFEGRNVAEILMKIVNQDPPPASSVNPKFSAAFDEALLRGVRKDKTQRPSSAGAFASEVAQSFGLDADHKRFAAMALSAVERAVSTTAPPPAPTPAPTPAPSTPRGEETSRVTVPMDSAPPVSTGGGSGWVLGLVAGLVVALIAGAAFFFLR